MRCPSLFVAAFLVFGIGSASSQEAAEPQPDPPAAAVETPAAPSGSIALELNKLMPVENACQAYMIVDNQSPQALQELVVDVYFFDEQGIVLTGLALQFTDVRSGRASVVPFELPELPCGEIGRVLLNKVLTCTNAEGQAVQGCAELLEVRTRAEVAFEY